MANLTPLLLYPWRENKVTHWMGSVPVWALWRREESFAAATNRTTVGSVRSLVAIPTTLLAFFYILQEISQLTYERHYTIILRFHIYIYISCIFILWPCKSPDLYFKNQLFAPKYTLKHSLIKNKLISTPTCFGPIRPSSGSCHA